MTLADNLRNKSAYNNQLAVLREQHAQGDFVLFVDAHFAGAYRSYAEALRSGYALAGAGDFFVKQIGPADESQRVVTPFAMSAG